MEYVRDATTIDKAIVYLQKYPESRYSVKMRGFIEDEYFKQAVDIESAEKYLELHLILLK